jgi:hypothetical protein
MIKSFHRRDFLSFLAGAGAGLIAAPAVLRAEAAPIVIRVGALKLIHSIAPYFYEKFVPPGCQVEVLPFGCAWKA